MSRHTNIFLHWWINVHNCVKCILQMSWNYLNCPVGNRIWQRGWRVQTQWPHVLLQKPKAWGVDDEWQPSLHVLPVLHVRQHHGAQQPAQVSPVPLCVQQDSCEDLCHWMLILHLGVMLLAKKVLTIMFMVFGRRNQSTFCWFHRENLYYIHQSDL